MTQRRDELPDDFGFDDFLAAVDELSAPSDVDLPTDHDGCVELVTLPPPEVLACLARLRDIGIDPHVELPGAEEAGDAKAMGSVFVPRGELVRARRVMGIQP